MQKKKKRADPQPQRFEVEFRGLHKDGGGLVLRFLDPSSGECILLGLGTDDATGMVSHMGAVLRHCSYAQLNLDNARTPKPPHVYTI